MKKEEEVNELKMNLAFSKKEADGRKEWLKKYNKEVILVTNWKKVLYSDFFDKDFYPLFKLW